MSQRKVIQLLVVPADVVGPQLYALCDDGSIWRRLRDYSRASYGPYVWELVPGPPEVGDE